MAGKRVYISFAAEDAAQCNLLTAALDAWEVTYTTARPALPQSGQLPELEQAAIRDCAVFLRLCTDATKRSEAMHQDLLFFDTLQAEDRRKHEREQRALVNLILDSGYQREPFDNVTLFIDTANKSRAFWLDELARPLGVATQARRLSRRSALALGVAGAVTLASGGAAATLFARNKAAADAATAQLKTLGPVTKASGQTAWVTDLSQYLDKKNPNYDGGLIDITAVDNTIYAASWNGIFALSSQGQLLWNYTGFQKEPSFQYIDLSNAVLYVNKDIIIVCDVEQSSKYLNILRVHDRSTVSRISFDTVGPVTVAGSTLYCLAEKGNIGGVFAFDLHTGQILWTTPLVAGTFVHEITYAAGRLYVGYPYNFVCLNAADGKQIWQQVLPDVIVGAATVANGMVYFGALDGFVYALDAQTGRLRWRYQTSSSLSAQPLIANGVVYIGDDSGFLWAFNGQSGGVYWRGLASDTGANAFEQPGSTSAAITSQPAIYKNAIAALAGAILTTFDITSGKPRWPFSVNGDSTQNDHSASGPLAINGLFIVGSQEGQVIAINP